MLSLIYLLCSSCTNKQVEENGKITSIYALMDNGTEDEVLQNRNNGIIIADTLKIYDIKGKQLYLKNIVKKHRVLILKYSAADCGKCIEFTLSELKKVHMNNVIIIVSDFPIRYLNTYLRDNKIETPVFIVDTFGLPLESESVPFFFALNADMKVSHSFIPRMEYQEKTKMYFESIIHILE